MSKEYNSIQNQKEIVECQLDLCQSAINYVRHGLSMKRTLNNTKGMRTQIEILQAAAKQLDHELVEWDNRVWMKENYQTKNELGAKKDSLHSSHTKEQK